MTDLDDELVRTLRQATAPAAPVDTEAALARVRSRALAVRRRRAAASVTALVAAAVTFGTIWIATRPPDQTQVDTISSPTSPISSTLPTTVPSTATTVATVPTTPPTIATPIAPAANAVAAPSAATQTTTGHTGLSRSVSVPVTVRGAGGSITARVQNGVLQLVSVQPAAGSQVTDQRVDPGEIEVRFESGAGRTRIKLRVEQGEISPEVEESSNDQGDDHGGTAPDDSGTAPDHGGAPGDEGGGSQEGDGSSSGSDTNGDSSSESGGSGADHGLD